MLSFTFVLWILKILRATAGDSAGEEVIALSESVLALVVFPLGLVDYCFVALPLYICFTAFCIICLHPPSGFTGFRTLYCCYAVFSLAKGSYLR